MNTNKLSIKLYLTLSLLILVTMGLAGCGTLEVGAISADTVDAGEGGIGAMEADEVQVKGIEIGIEPPSMLTYTNDFYGFKFDYPETWSLTEEEHRVVLMKGTNRLGINFHWVNEDIRGRTGVGAGDFIYSDKLIFMDQIIPVETLLYEGKDKAIFYNGTSSIEVDDLVFGIVLEDLETEYMVLDLPEDVIPEANAILESFVRIEATGTLGESSPTPDAAVIYPVNPDPDWLLYTNPNYDFGFYYPADMTVVEEPNLVKVGRDSMQLLIAFRSVDEDIQIVEPMALNGKYYPIDELDFLARELRVFINTYNERVKAVYFGDIGIEQDDGSLVTAIHLRDTSASEISAGAAIDDRLIVEMTAIVKSFGRFQTPSLPEPLTPPEEPVPAAPEEVALDMSVYENREYGFSFLYPSYMSVAEEPNKVHLLDPGNCQMTIAYQRVDEELQIADIGEVTGQLISYGNLGEISFLGTVVDPYINVQEGYITSAYLGSPGDVLGEGTPLRFVISMVNIEGGRLANAQVDAMLRIFDSFALASWSD